MTQPADAIARDQVVRSLTPFFLDAAHGNDTDASAAADAMIAGFNPQSTEELMLAAQVVVYGLAGLDSLRRSAAEPDLSVATHLRLRGNANAMQRAAQQCRRALELRRKAGTTPDAATTPARTFTEADLREAIKTASAVIAEARAAGQPLAPMNRAARRAAEKQARRTAAQIAA